MPDGATGVVGAKGPAITVTEYVIPTTSNPGAIATGPDGNIWFTHQSTAPSAIGRLAPSGTGFMLFKTSTTNTGPVAIAGGSDGNVWYTKQGGIGRMTPAGTFNEYGVPNGGDSGGLTSGPDGNLWFTEPRANKIGRITPAGAFMEYPVPTASSGPAAITVGPDMNLWFTEASAAGNKIGRVTPAGAFMEFPIPTAASDASAIAKGPDGNLWFSEHDGHKIGRVTPAGVVTEFPIPSVGSPGSIAGARWQPLVHHGGQCQFPSAASRPPAPSPICDSHARQRSLRDYRGPRHEPLVHRAMANKIGRISNLAGGGTLDSGTGGGATAPTPGMVCTTDTHCLGSGKACGGDVCSWKVTPHSRPRCLANSGDPGWCTADAKCWCAGEGATCDMAKHACSATVHSGG